MNIAIASHRRSKIFEEKTLSFLLRTGVKRESITVFVSDQQDVDDYSFLKIKIINTNAKNIKEKFNFIHFYYDIGEEVVALEDDIEDIVSGSGTNEKGEVKDFYDICKKGFSHIPMGGIWGIVPHHNTFFFNPKVTQELKIVAAYVFGFISTKDPRLSVTQESKHDYERTILYYIRYGETIRLDFAGVKTNNYKNAGGLNFDYGGNVKRYQKEKEACIYLVKKYPHLIKMNVKKSLTSEYPELSLIKNSYSSKQLQLAQRKIDEKNGNTSIW